MRIFTFLAVLAVMFAFATVDVQATTFPIETMANTVDTFVPTVITGTTADTSRFYWTATTQSCDVIDMTAFRDGDFTTIMIQ